MREVKFLRAGDRALTVEFGSTVDPKINDQVHALAAKLRKENVPGIKELVPAFRSLTIYYDPLKTSFQAVRQNILSYGDISQEGGTIKKRIWKIPCCYGARFGCDLADMEAYTGLDRDEIIAIHSSVDYKIYMMGFLPGFVYLGGLDKRIEMPRLKTPRVKILPGAVGIGGSQTGVYPVASPGGWRLLGGTPVEFYDPGRKEPVLCKAGEYIRFVPITINDYYDIRRMVSKGEYEPEVEEGNICQ
ncbi:5-oxoprolinase subunit PxpB [[Clostridium] hylemonae]|uniref:5-oxoprolinase subunit PxpB n=1 Tax=[Clostridium] hylemonae TaxID=89153 RepID=UPI001FCC945E|nr:5-oxoprolinase subunit PxpB [[Clostridium] hylemonae]